MSTQKQFQSRSLETTDNKPLRRTQEYLKELKVSVTLLRELLVEVKELIVVLALIAFFIWGVVELFQHLHG
jgi:hypothetical protein